MHFFKKIGMIVLSLTILTGGFLPTTSYANHITDEQTESKIAVIHLVNSEFSRDEITSIITEYANEEGISFEEAVHAFYIESKDEKEETISNNIQARRVSSPDESLGKARNKGDVFYSKAWTGINHGHSGIFYSRSTVIHAPGLKQRSRLESSSNKLGKKGGIQLQYVKTSQINRDKDANYAYNYLRGKSYSKNFLFNKNKTDYVWNIKSINCSALVWMAYYRSSGFKIDLDSNGGPGVYPSNIRDSKLTVTYIRR